MKTIIQGVGKVIGFALVFAVSTTWAQDTVRVRGTTDRIEGPIYVVKTVNGDELKVILGDNASVVGVVKASSSDLKPGSFVGVAGMQQLTGAKRQSRCISFRNRNVEAGKGTTRGICGRRAP